MVILNSHTQTKLLQTESVTLQPSISRCFQLFFPLLILSRDECSTTNLFQTQGRFPEVELLAQLVRILKSFFDLQEICCAFTFSNETQVTVPAESHLVGPILSNLLSSRHFRPPAVPYN